MKLILLGAPGCGKGTQAEMLSERYSLPIISTGNILKQAVRDESDLGIKVKHYMENGLLVPDDIVIDIAAERLGKSDCKNGYILDGFPRTLKQAEAFDKMLAAAGEAVDCVLDIIVDDAKIVERLSGRRICRSCQSTYHTGYNPPKVCNICDKCGGELMIRDDDKPEIVLERLKIYHEQTAPLKDYYENQKKLVLVFGCEEIADTSREVITALEGFFGGKKL